MLKHIFADTFYWIALSNQNDSWHKKAKSISQEIYPFQIITTDEVLIEFMNYLGDRGHYLRAKAVQLVQSILVNPNIEIIPQSRDSFYAGFQLYQDRPDKGYSLTDCISMICMRRESLVEVLTHDHHFAQEGFELLLK